MLDHHCMPWERALQEADGLAGRVRWPWAQRWDDGGGWGGREVGVEKEGGGVPVQVVQH